MKRKKNTRQNPPPDHPVQTTLIQRALTPVDAASTALFRIVFGAVVLWEAIYHIRGNLITERFLTPELLFKYYGFSWVRVLTGQWEWVMHALPWILGGAAVFVAIGLLYRLSIFLVFAIWTYMFLLDQAVYINHFYLLSLVAGMMIFIPAHRCWSIDAYLFPKLAQGTVPAWCVWILRFQMGAVYFFAGVAKMDPDWLGGQALTLILMEKTPNPAMHQPMRVLFFSWSGMLFDTLVTPGLLWKRSRLIVFTLAILFHLTNWFFLFDIGSFPAFAMAATSMFLAPSWPRPILNRLRPLLPSIPRSLDPSFPRSPDPSIPRPPTHIRPYQRAGLIALSAYVLVQLILPLRPYFFYPGNPNWNYEGHRFSWRMMVNWRHVPLDQVQFMLVDPETGRRTPASLYKLAGRLQGWQMRLMLTQPDMLVQFGHYCDEKMRGGGYHRELYARIPLSLNGRPPRLFLDETVDITKLERTLRHCDWITPAPTEPAPPLKRLHTQPPPWSSPHAPSR